MSNLKFERKRNGTLTPAVLLERCHSCGQVVPAGQLHERVRGEGIRCLC